MALPVFVSRYFRYVLLEPEESKILLPIVTHHIPSEIVLLSRRLRTAARILSAPALSSPLMRIDW